MITNMSISDVLPAEITCQLEPNIKATLINHLRRSGVISLGTPILSEFSIFDGARRADLCIIIKNRMIAFEIKSEADSLTRLEGQIEDYLNYFDKVVVVTAPKFTAQIKEKVPKNVGIWEINNDSITQKQRGNISLNRDKKYLTSMLRKKDLDALKRTHKSNSLDSINEFKIRKFVLNNISSRYQPYFLNFWHHIENRHATVCDLKHLSPYIEAREMITKRRQDLEKSWQKIQSPDFIENIHATVMQIKQRIAEA